ncbi:phage tail protein [Candidatus Williamhamiltonella defendens]|nr:tail fiber assembly protein [Candidatus Hamiltonella defensa]AYB48623.1 phage tail protein [Candidatus Hamiltonella defensa]
MKMYKNFNKTDIEALSEKQRELKYNINASYLQDENGDDWYDLQKTFQPDTFKVMFDEKNTVVSIARDASTLFPLNCNIVELDSLPEGAENNGEWIFDGHQVVRGIYTEAERTRQAAREKEKWMDRASKAIGPLADAVELGIATEQEVQALKIWKAYRVALHRLEPKAGEITWPEVPRG